MGRLLLLPLLALALLPQAASSAADNPKLIATVGPGATISLTTEAGTRVTRLEAGTYDVVVSDRATEHNFHLTGPGVDRFTEVEETGTVTWTLTLRDGAYTFVCDPHAFSMVGRFTVGDAPPPLPPPTATPQKLTATVGPAATIGLRTAGGAVVRSLKAGDYAITVRDRAAVHNFRLVGPGVSRRTTVKFRGTQTWKLRLRAGTYRFLCEPHKARMKGSFRVG